MTYQLQPKPDQSVDLADPGNLCPHCAPRIHTPVATLKDEYGGVSHIIIDDHCYVLVNGTKTVKHWYKEAVAALQTLPADPRGLEPSVCCAAPGPAGPQPGPPVQEAGQLT